jgi:hypothetical protein
MCFKFLSPTNLIRLFGVLLILGILVCPPVLTEAHIQVTEHKQMYPILIKHQIIRYFRHVDSIHFIYNQRKNKDETLGKFSEQETTIKFTIEKKLHNSINVLDL